jgi:type I restriction enzyme S subunit
MTELAAINPPVSLPHLDPDELVSFIPMSDVSETGQWVIRQTRRLHTIKSGYTPFQEGDVLFAKITPCMENGKGCHAVGLVNGVGFGTTEFHVLRARPGNHARFIYHWAQSEALRRKAEAMMTGSAGQRRVPAQLFGRFEVPLLPFAEQCRIADILDVADAAIRQTDALIAKLKQIKAGLLHDLLTRGLDAHGRLRDPVAHPEQFVESAVGRIPRGWEACQISDLLYDVIDFRGKTPLKIGLEWGGGNIPALSANNVEMGRINLSKETYYGSEKLYRRWMTKGVCTKGDIIITMEAPLGNVAQIPDDRKYILSQRVLLLKTRSERVFNDFLKHELMSTGFQSQLAQNATGTTAKGIQQAKFMKLLVPLPPFSEQVAVAEALDAHDVRIRAEEAYRDKLVQVKRGLMEDLLTGRVRVV